MGTGGVFLRRIRAQVSDEPTGFLWVEKGKLAASGYPASRAQVQWLARQGVNAILTLTEDPLPSESVEGLGLALGHVPMHDHEAPEVSSLQRGADFINLELTAGRSVAVHCLAGEGRTGSVLAAYFIKYRGMSSNEALKFIRASKPGFVEWKQEKSLPEFEAFVRPKGSG